MWTLQKLVSLVSVRLNRHLERFTFLWHALDAKSATTELDNLPYQRQSKARSFAALLKSNICLVIRAEKIVVDQVFGLDANAGIMDLNANDGNVGSELYANIRLLLSQLALESLLRMYSWVKQLRDTLDSAVLGELAGIGKKI